jgi:hypothetical protein
VSNAKRRSRAREGWQSQSDDLAGSITGRGGGGVFSSNVARAALAWSAKKE